MQPRKIQIATIHHVVAPRMHRELVQRSHFVPFPLVQTGEYRDVCAQIEQHAELHRGQGLLPARPWKQGQTQFDHRGIQREQVGLQSECRRPIHVKSLRPTHQDAGDRSEDPPVAMIVGVGQIGSRHATTKSHAVCDRRTRAQARLDAPQALSISQLRKNHRRKMIVNTQRARCSWHRETSRCTRDFSMIYSCQDLREGGWSGIHSTDQFAGNRNFQSKSRTLLKSHLVLPTNTIRL